MPEQPEVERAIRQLREVVVGRRLTGLQLLHAAVGRRLSPRDREELSGRTIVAAERYGKHQLLVLDDGRALGVHFRMAGDWQLDRVGAPLPAHARAALELDDGARAVLVDPRALSSIQLVDRAALAAALGPDPTDPALDAGVLRRSLASRRGAIKPVLLDQRVLAGVGNIYAAEALWHAAIDPRTSARALGPRRVQRLLDGVRTALALGERAATRYGSGEDVGALAVYGRAGESCRRCGGTVRRIVQAARSTYFCPRCQRR